MSPESHGSPEQDHGSLADALASIEQWEADVAAAAASGPLGVLGSHGELDAVLAVASLTKLVTAWAVLIAMEEGAVDLADRAGPPDSTVAHLLAHASGWDFDTRQVLARPGSKRIYSNTGYEALARHVEQATSISFVDYLTEAVLEPLGMTDSELRGSAATDLHTTVGDLLRFIGEMRDPALIDASTAQTAFSVRFPGLAGVVPGWGRHEPCDWGYGPELRGSKSPHWMGGTAGADTLGHFGGWGSLLWLDPGSGVACVALSDRPFGDWSIRAWPVFSDRVRSAAGGLPATA